MDVTLELARALLADQHPDLARRRAMAAYAASEATWARARGWASLMIVMLLSITGNPRMPAMGRRMMSWLAAGP